MTSEQLRQREVHKYYQSWLDSSIGFDADPSVHISRYHADGSQIRPSKDKALIAFAQLGCLRLDAKRSVVTLISTEQQYILAEATKTLSLVSGDGDYEVQDGIWFGNASLPRFQGVSGDALTPSNYTANGDNGSSYTAPALVVNDLTLDERYCTRPYAGTGVTFYCGVPILTESGIPIGVYTVTDDKPRNGLQPGELRFMNDMATTVMRHLDIISGEAARFRGETMVTGMGRFISGADSLHDKSLPTTGYTTQATSPDLKPSGTSVTRTFKGMTITAATPSKLRSTGTIFTSTPAPTSNKTESSVISSLGSDVKEPNETDSALTPTDIQPNSERSQSEILKKADTSQRKRQRSQSGQRLVTKPESIFSRAAKILQECVAAEGVLFFDAALTNLAQQTTVSSALDRPVRSTSNPIPQQTRSEEIADDQLNNERMNGVNNLYSGASEDSDNGAFDDTENRMCKLLGYALDESAQLLSGMNVLENLQMTERSLSRLVKMYPDGKLFSFHGDDDLPANDRKHLTEDNLQTQRLVTQRNPPPTENSRRIPRAIASEIERLVPHARSIVWLPLWDLSKQRWSAGLFLWSSRPDRLVAAHDDLLYLKVFANSIMVEVARLDAALADTAKATFIANISHELRTPLHGILGNLDILQDTQLTEFQTSLVTAIEVCGRTLSDTIDHVLDYSKINQLSKHQRKRTKSSSIALPLLTQTSLTQNLSSFEEDFNIATIVEEAVEAASASYSFQFSGRIRLRASSIHGSQSPISPLVSNRKAQKVHVIVDIEHRESWQCHSQPSAIRRVVTNLFGNALKYTDEGTIRVTLSSPKSAVSSHPGASIPILLSVKDTGRGMSEDFVRNHAFTPFSQESQFSTGTGLGLSIVQQIVKSLSGKIELQSNQNVGTEMRVLLQLPPAHQDINTGIISQSLKGSKELNQRPTSFRIMTAEKQSTDMTASSLRPVLSALEEMIRTWFGLHVQGMNGVDTSEPDIILYATPPTPDQLLRNLNLTESSSLCEVIVVASDTIEKAELTGQYSKLAALSCLRLNVLSYPLGPQKLGRAISRCLKDIQEKRAAVNMKKKSHEMVPALRLVSFEPAADEPAATDLPARNNRQIAPSDSKDISSISQVEKRYEQGPSEGPSTPKQAGRHSRVSSVAGELTESQQLSNKRKPSADLSSSSPHKANTPRRPPAIMPRSISAPAPLPLSNDDAGANADAPIRVLLVDDNDINLSILKTCMKRAQIPYDFAKDGLQAVNTFEQAFNANAAFTHVLMDISMPVMDGIQATREIRDFERRQNNLQRVSSRASELEHAASSTSSSTTTTAVTETNAEPDSLALLERAFVIALSGVASETAQLDMLEAGADMFLAKPVKLKELVNILGS